MMHIETLPDGKKRVTRQSPLTGNKNAMDLDISVDQIARFLDPGRTELVQDIFPNLSAEEREFLMTGYTPADWLAMFPKEDDDEE